MRSRKDVYYRIGEAARILDISRSSLRNWERMGLLTPVRSQGLYRLYSRAELQKLQADQVPSQYQARQSSRHRGDAAKGNAGRTRRFRRWKIEKEGLGENLSRLRRQASLTLTAVAKSTGVSPSFLSAIERDTANPSIATLQKLARLYTTPTCSPSSARRAMRRGW